MFGDAHGFHLPCAAIGIAISNASLGAGLRFMFRGSRWIASDVGERTSCSGKGAHDAKSRRGERATQLRMHSVPILIVRSSTRRCGAGIGVLGCRCARPCMPLLTLEFVCYRREACLTATCRRGCINLLCAFVHGYCYSCVIPGLVAAQPAQVLVVPRSTCAFGRQHVLRTRGCSR